jgi:hypothetical protein
MPTFDLHYHPNIANLKRPLRERKLERHKNVLATNRPDCVACTEHAYKRPLDAYLYLADAAKDLKTEILPGVEGVSREGVDIIFIYASEADLKSALKEQKPFAWSIKDVGRIRNATGAVSIVPHPFSLSRSGAGNVLSQAGYQRVLRMVDYVEIHNGSALTLMQRLSTKNARPLFKKTMETISWTINLPREHRGQGLGWAVSSDAHFPEEQFIIGATEEQPGPGESLFDLLGRRVRFEALMVSYPSENNIVNNFRLFRTMRCAMAEGINKDMRQMRQSGVTEGDVWERGDKIVQMVGREVRKRAVKALRSGR